MNKPSHYYCTNVSDSVPNLSDNNNLKTGSNKYTDTPYANRSHIINDREKSQNANKLLGKPPIGEKNFKSFFGVSLEDREMPITRERQTKWLNVATKRSSDGGRTAIKPSGSPQSVRGMFCKNDSATDPSRIR